MPEATTTSTTATTVQPPSTSSPGTPPTLTATPSQITARQQVTFAVEGFAADALVMFESDGSIIGSVRADAAGRAAITAAGLPQPGVYTVRAWSLDGRRSSVSVTVVASESPTPSTVGDVLPETGSEPSGRLWMSLALVLVGAFLVGATRRRHGDIR